MTAAERAAQIDRAADLARAYARPDGAQRWTRPDGAVVQLDTYQPTYKAVRPDGTERHTYTAQDALLWIGAPEA